MKPLFDQNVSPWLCRALAHSYEPDFLVRLANSVTVVLEIKGFEEDQTKAKHTAAKRWVTAINNYGQLGRWEFHVCRNPQMPDKDMEYVARAESRLSARDRTVRRETIGQPWASDFPAMPNGR